MRRGVQTDSCAQALGELRDLEPIWDLHFRCRSLKDGPNSNFPEGKESSGRDSSDQGDRPSFLQSRCRIVASLLPLSPVVKALKGTIGSMILPVYNLVLRDQTCIPGQWLLSRSEGKRGGGIHPRNSKRGLWYSSHASFFLTGCSESDAGSI